MANTVSFTLTPPSSAIPPADGLQAPDTFLPAQVVALQESPDLFQLDQPLPLPDHPGLIYKGLLSKGGGFGVVHRLYDSQRKRYLALKIPIKLDNPHVQQNFHQEAKTLFELMSEASHPNVVSPVCSLQVDGVPWLITELVDGPSLAWLLEGDWDRTRTTDHPGSGSTTNDQAQRQAPPGGHAPAWRSNLDDFTQRLSIALDIAAGMAFVHDHGLLHLDLKPDNVVIDDQQGIARLIDFGLAQTAQAYQEIQLPLLAEEQTGSTMSLSFLQGAGWGGGTRPYMAPEQFQGFAYCTPATDLYAFGILLHVLELRRHPFHAPEDTTKAWSHLHLHQPVDEMALRNGVSHPDLARLILDCLAKDPEQRPPSFTQVHTRLTTIYQQVAGHPAPSLEARDENPDQQLERLKRQAYWRIERDPRQAEELLRQALTLAPGDSWILGYLAATLRILRRQDEAEALARQAVEQDKNNFHAWDLLRLFSFERGDFKQAQDLGKTIESLHPCEPVYTAHRIHLDLRILEWDLWHKRYTTKFPQGVMVIHIADACQLPLPETLAQHLAQAHARWPHEPSFLEQQVRLAQYQGRQQQCLVDPAVQAQLESDVDGTFGQMFHMIQHISLYHQIISSLESELPSDWNGAVHVALATLLASEPTRRHEGMTLLEKYLKGHPGCCQAWRTLGRLRREAGDPAGGIEALRQAQRLDPDQPAVLGELCWALAASGTPWEGIQKMVDDFVPGHWVRDDFWNLVGLAAELSRQPAYAAEAFRKALEHSPHDGHLVGNWMQCLRQIGQIDQAVEVAQAWLVDHKDTAPAAVWNQLGLAEAARGRHIPELFHQALELDQQEPYFIGNRMDSLRQTDQAAQAVSEGRAWLRTHGATKATAYVWFYLGKAEAALGQHAQAIECFGRGMQLSPWDSNVLGNRLSSLRQSGQAEQALAEGRAWLTQQEHSQTLATDFFWSQLGLAEDMLGQHAQAAESFRRAQVLAPKNPLYPGNRMTSLCALGQAAQALTEGRAWLAEHGENLANDLFWNQLGLVQDTLGQQALASESFRRALVLAPENHTYIVHLMDSLRKMGHPEQALAEGQAWLEHRQTLATCVFWNMFGLVLDALGQHALAAESYRRAMVLAPENARYIGNRMTSICAMGHPEQALAEGRAWLAEHGEHLADSLLWYRLALAELALKRHAAAAEWFRHALAQAPHQQEFLVNRMVCLIHIGQTAQALAEGEAWLQSHGASQASAQLHQALDLARTKTQAVADGNQTPNQPSAHSTTSGDHQMAEPASRLQPDSGRTPQRSRLGRLFTMARSLVGSLFGK